MKKEISFPKGAKSINFDLEQGIATAIYEEEKPALKVGEWRNSDIGGNILITSYDSRNALFSGVGIDDEGNWGTWTDIMFETKPSDMQEVTKLLIGEAEKRGFKKGVKFLSVIEKKERIATIDKFHLFDKDLGIYISEDKCAGIFNFESGKWAEIVKKPIVKPPLGLMPSNIWKEKR